MKIYLNPPLYRLTYHLALLHKEHYPTSHLTSKLPLPLVWLLYKILLSTTHSYVVATSGDRIVGFGLVGLYPRSLKVLSYLFRLPKVLASFTFSLLPLPWRAKQKPRLKANYILPRTSNRLLSILVHTDYRSNGLAQQLIQALEQNCIKLGHTRLGLSVKSCNAPAVRLYQKLGYSPTVNMCSDSISIDFVKEFSDPF